VTEKSCNFHTVWYLPLSSKKFTTSLCPFSQALKSKVLAPPGAKLIKFCTEPESKAVSIDFTAGKSPCNEKREK